MSEFDKEIIKELDKIVELHKEARLSAKETILKTFRELSAKNRELIEEIEKHRWIPVKEKLPQETGPYQVVRKGNKNPTTREFCADSHIWYTSDIVTHWKQIIIPAKEEHDDE